MILELQMLQIMVMPCDVEIHLRFLQQRSPPRNQDRIIPVNSIREQGMMRNHNQKRNCPRLRQLSLQPHILSIPILLRHQVTPRPGIERLRSRQVRIQTNELRHRILLRKIERVPASRHRPSSFVLLRIIQLHLDLVDLQLLVIMIPKHSISRSRKPVRRIHILKLLLPPLHPMLIVHLPIPVIPKHK